MICTKCRREIPDDARLCCYCGRVYVAQPSRKRRGNGQGCAYRRGATWTAKITLGFTEMPDGRLRQDRTTKGGFRTKADALAYVKRLQEGGGEKQAPNLAHYWKLYEKDDLAKLSDSKIMAYGIAWKKLAGIQLRPVDALTVSDLRGVVNEKATSYYTARDMKQVLTHLYRLAGADGWVSKDLPSYITLPKLEEKERTPFTREEQTALWRLYEGGDLRAALPLVMIYTGMMPGEFQQLRPEMIDWKEHTIRGAGMKTKVRKKAPIYVIDALRPVLEDLIAVSPGKYVLARNEARFYEDYYGALEAAGCRRLEPYCCRHTTATALAVDANIAPATIRKAMRWSTVRMLDRYAHPAEQETLEAMQAIGPDADL